MSKKISINLATQKFKEKLTQDIQNSKLPAVNVLLVWQSMLRDIEGAYYASLNAELAQQQQEANSQEEEET